jgi:hypothetical protein
VGTGGANHTTIIRTAANSEITDVTTFGVLKLTLHPTSYDWQFVPEAGGTFTDSGSGNCHGTTGDTIPPSAPANLSTTTISTNQVGLSWKASTDNVGLANYQIYQGRTLVGTATKTSFLDTTVQPQSTYSYYVLAVDNAGNPSAQSNTVSVTTPPGAPSSIFLPMVVR